jgi:hypothetical protein
MESAGPSTSFAGTQNLDESKDLKDAVIENTQKLDSQEIRESESIVTDTIQIEDKIPSITEPAEPIKSEADPIIPSSDET